MSKSVAGRFGGHGRHFGRQLQRPHPVALEVRRVREGEQDGHAELSIGAAARPHTLWQRAQLAGTELPKVRGVDSGRARDCDKLRRRGQGRQRAVEPAHPGLPADVSGRAVPRTPRRQVHVGSRDQRLVSARLLAATLGVRDDGMLCDVLRHGRRFKGQARP